jgi:hypothetical protein
MATKLALIAALAMVVVEHDGVKYGPGQDAGAQFELTEAQAKPLLDVGAIELVEVEAETAATDGAAPAAKAVKKT